MAARNSFPAMNSRQAAATDGAARPGAEPSEDHASGAMRSIARVFVEVVAAYLGLVLVLTWVRSGAAERGLPMEGSGATGWHSHTATLVLLLFAGGVVVWRLRRLPSRYGVSAATLLGLLAAVCVWRWQRWMELAYDPLEPAGTSDVDVSMTLLLTAVVIAPMLGALPLVLRSSAGQRELRLDH